MIKISDEAKSEIIKAIEEANVDGHKAVRVYSQGFGWGGPRLGLALDEPSDNDNVFEQDGFDIIIEKGLLRSIKGVAIQFNGANHWYGSGFRIDPLYGRAGCG